MRANVVPPSLEPADRCRSVAQLSAYWRCAPRRVRELIRRGLLVAFALPGSRRLRITPEAVAECERLLAAGKARPRRQRTVSGIDPEVAALLEGDK